MQLYFFGYLIMLLLGGGVFVLCHRAIRTNRLKVILNGSFAAWTLLFAVLVPMVLSFTDYTIREDVEPFYLPASTFLVLGYAVFALICSRINIRPAFFEPSQFLAFLAILAVGVILLLSPVTSVVVQATSFTVFVVPCIACLYGSTTGQSRKTGLVVFLHIALGLVLIWTGFLTDSKERIAVFFVVPFLLARMLSGKEVRMHELPLWGLTGLAVFIVAQPIVTFYRFNNSGEQLAVEQLYRDPENIATQALYRLAVVDAMAMVLKNEFSEPPLRPTEPMWTVVGPVIQLFPSFGWERPNHAREALFLSGYQTSHDDVNIALTYAGHLIWSFGLPLAIVSLPIYWLSCLSLFLWASKFSPVSSLFFFCGAVVNTVRLESLSNVYLGNLLFAFVAALIVDLVCFRFNASSERRIGNVPRSRAGASTAQRVTNRRHRYVIRSP